MTMPPSPSHNSSPANAAETPDAIADRVLGVISTTKRLPRESVTPDSSFESLGIDSLDRLNILFDLENEFDIQINDEDAKQVTTIREMIAGVEQLVAARGQTTTAPDTKAPAAAAKSAPADATPPAAAGPAATPPAAAEPASTGPAAATAPPTATGPETATRPETDDVPAPEPAPAANPATEPATQPAPKDSERSSAAPAV